MISDHGTNQGFPAIREITAMLIWTAVCVLESVIVLTWPDKEHLTKPYKQKIFRIKLATSDTVTGAEFLNIKSN